MNQHMTEAFANEETNGEEIVSPDYHLDTTNLPDDARESSHIFKTRFLEHHDHDNLAPLNHTREGYEQWTGSSPKCVFRIAGGHENGVAKPAHHFMVKAYHEFMDHPYIGNKFPLSGWSDMTYANLLHKSGLGHMAMDIHAFPYEDKALIGIRINPDYHPVGNIGQFTRRGETQPNVFGKDGKQYGLVTIPDQQRNEAAKVAALDFLTNNQDRNALNMMFSYNPPANEGEYPKMADLLAIDNGRAFQYLIPSRFAPHSEYGGDHLTDYFKAPGFKAFGFDRHLFAPMANVADWWRDNKLKLREEFLKNLTAIREPRLKSHILNSYLSREKILDRLEGILEQHGAVPLERGFSTHATTAQRSAWAKLEAKILPHPWAGVFEENE